MEVQVQRPQEAHDGRKLHGELQSATDHRADGQQYGQARFGMMATSPEKSRDHGDVPDDRSSVGEEEPVVAVQNPEAPRRKHQQSRTWKENLNQSYGEQALIAVEAGCDEIDQPRRGQYSSEDQYSGDEEQPGEDSLGELRGLFVAVLRV